VKKILAIGRVSPGKTTIDMTIDFEATKGISGADRALEMLRSKEWTLGGMMREMESDGRILPYDPDDEAKLRHESPGEK